MNVGLLGFGRMGQAISRVITEIEPDVGLAVYDTNQELVASQLKSFSAEKTEIFAASSVHDLHERSDVMILAIPWDACEKYLREHRSLGTPVVIISRPPGDGSLLESLSEQRSGPVVGPVGLEPGLTEILAQHLGKRFQRVENAQILCGGVTKNPPRGFPYRPMFGTTELPFGMRDAYMLRKGELKRVPRFSEQRLEVIDDLGELESYHDGMVPWLQKFPEFEQADVDQRTLRWPGFSQAVRLLNEWGFLSAHPVDVEGHSSTARDLTRAIVWQVGLYGEFQDDVCILEVRVKGLSEGSRHSKRVMLVADRHGGQLPNGLAKLTAIPAVLSAFEIVGREGELRGWIKAEELLRGSLQTLREMLERFGVQWIDESYDE